MMKKILLLLLAFALLFSMIACGNNDTDNAGGEGEGNGETNGGGSGSAGGNGGENNAPVIETPLVDVTPDAAG